MAYAIGDFYQEGATSAPPLSLASGGAWTFEEDKTDGLHLAWIEVDLSPRDLGVSIEVDIRAINRHAIGLWLRCLGPTGGMWSQDIDLWGFQPREAGVEDCVDLGWCQASRSHDDVCRIHWSLGEIPAGQRIRLYFVSKQKCGEASPCKGLGSPAFEISNLIFGPAKRGPSQLLHPTLVHDARIATCRDYYDLMLARFPASEGYGWLDDLKFDLDEYRVGYLRGRLGAGVTTCQRILLPRRPDLLSAVSTSWGAADGSLMPNDESAEGIQPEQTMIVMGNLDETISAIKHMKTQMTRRLIAIVPISLIVDFGLDALRELAAKEADWIASDDHGTVQELSFSAAWTLYTLCAAAGIKVSREWLGPFLAKRVNLADGILMDMEPVRPAPDWQEGQVLPLRQSLLCCDVLLGAGNA